MKKENRSRVAAVKKYCAVRSGKIVDFVCILLAVLTAFVAATSLLHLPTVSEIVACKEELASYIASPSRYAVNTDKYTLEISSDGTELSINGSLASCIAVFDNTTNNFNYTIHRFIFITILGWICFSIAFGFCLYFVFFGIYAIGSEVYKQISKAYHEYKLNKAEADLNLTHEEAKEYELSIQRKAEFDYAYKKGFDAGYTDGRSKGFKQGQYDAYEEGYAKGYTDGQNEVAEEIDSFMNDESSSCEGDDETFKDKLLRTIAFDDIDD